MYPLPEQSILPWDDFLANWSILLQSYCSQETSRLCHCHERVERLLKGEEKMMPTCCKTFPHCCCLSPIFKEQQRTAHNTIKYYCWIYRGLHLHKLSGEIIKTKRGKINSFPSRVRRVVRIYLNLIIWRGRGVGCGVGLISSSGRQGSRSYHSAQRDSWGHI